METQTRMKKYFCFDTETGGLSERTSLLTLYGIITDENLEPVDSISLKLKPSDGVFLVEGQALEINKINLDKHSRIADTYEVGAKKLKDFLSRHVENHTRKLDIIGQNVIEFDIPRVKNFLLSDEEFSFYFSRETKDTKVQGIFLKTLGIIPGDVNSSLITQLKFFFPDLNLDGHHDAKWDTEHTLKLYKKHVSILE